MYAPRFSFDLYLVVNYIKFLVHFEPIFLFVASRLYKYQRLMPDSYCGFGTLILVGCYEKQGSVSLPHAFYSKPGTS